jgi:hypothetical protein
MPTRRPYLDAWSALRPGSIVLWSIDPREGWFASQRRSVLYVVKVSRRAIYEAMCKARNRTISNVAFRGPGRFFAWGCSHLHDS